MYELFSFTCNKILHVKKQRIIEKVYLKLSGNLCFNL